MVIQLSIFSYNCIETLINLNKIFSKEEIFIWGLYIRNNSEYAIIRMISSNSQKASQILNEFGYFFSTTEVTGVKVKNEIGSYYKLFCALYEGNINIKYIYTAYYQTSNQPILIFSSDDIYEVEECLISKGFSLI